jgi:hypothetical protein
MQEDGQFYSGEQLKAADKFGASWDRLAGTLNGLKNTLGLDLAQTLLPYLDQLREWLNLNRELIKDKFTVFLKHIPPFVESVTQAFSFFASVLSPVFGLIKLILCRGVAFMAKKSASSSRKNGRPSSPGRLQPCRNDALSASMALAPGQSSARPRRLSGVSTVLR